ncbi:unnamed protein product, partial [Sphacelaria rigidula]
MPRRTGRQTDVLLEELEPQQLMSAVLREFLLLMAAIRRGKGDVIPVAPQSADTPSRPESPSGPGGSGAFLEHSQSNSNSNSNNSANKNNSPRNQFGGPGLSASSGGFAFGVE